MYDRVSNGSEIFCDPRNGKAWNRAQALRRIYWYPALIAAGIRKRAPRQTRHTFASQLLMDGANPLYVAKQMGHKDWGMIRRVYGRYLES